MMRTRDGTKSHMGKTCGNWSTTGNRKGPFDWSRRLFSRTTSSGPWPSGNRIRCWIQSTGSFRYWPSTFDLVLCSPKTLKVLARFMLVTFYEAFVACK